ncbi:hypothetical protein Tco_0488398 [Tanacetum coccineum]
MTARLVTAAVAMAARVTICGSMEMWWWWDVVDVVEMKMKVMAARGGDGVAVTMVLVVYGETMGLGSGGVRQRWR